MRILLLNQAFYPDVVATAQMAADLAAHLALRGHEVSVVSGRRGYDNPSKAFPSEERWRGVRILRVPSLNLGKKSRWRRAVNFGSFMFSCSLRLFTIERQDVVIALTSPPLISWLAALFVRLRGGRLVFWVMDLNPDEAQAAGWLSESSFVFRRLDSLLQYSLRMSSCVVALDRFMKDRIASKGIPESRIAVIPPWPHDDQVAYDEAGRSAFRREHGLENCFVVMYSGNLSPLHPLDSLLQAALRLRDRPDIRFLFVGGGSKFQEVKDFAVRHELGNILCLPYQPIDKLSASLSSADLHTVVMGDTFVGIIHPCKIYNILNLGIPFLYIGPAASHVVDLMEAVPGVRAFACRHGDVEAVAAAVTMAADLAGGGVGARARQLPPGLTQQNALERMTSIIEETEPVREKQ